jgi:hypothetical protein
VVDPHPANSKLAIKRIVKVLMVKNFGITHIYVAMQKRFPKLIIE